ncbi:hypothetical protein LWC34_14265 [Kibdelosporangium philippinense]|uniref:Uncharacterized protein n=1 Tax=Kibdelosporangium philippinense TaxID=211113 RepID=A0ABS8ZBC1_9PSEU|nr:hypothetical protein [Kibdelosporangium philippinense]MCE7003986.1 hypothetical protein [Kibdelosporangium philippinense]
MTSADTRDMSMAHTMFRREFAALPALVRTVAVGDTERADVVAEHMAPWREHASSQHSTARTSQTSWTM